MAFPRGETIAVVFSLALGLSLGVASCGPQETVRYAHFEPRLERIRKLQEQENFEASIEELRQVLDRAPDHPEANYRLGLALATMGALHRAVWPLERAAAAEAYATRSGVALAQTLLASLDFEEAIRASSRVLEREPEHALALRLRAAAQIAAKRPEGALRDAERALALAADDLAALWLRSAALVELDRYDEAERGYGEIERLAKRKGIGTLEINSCLALASFFSQSRHDSERAEAEFRRCVQLAPSDRRVVEATSAFYVRLERPDEASDLWQRALAAEPDSVFFAAGLARRLEAAGESEEAERVLERIANRAGSPAAWTLLSHFHRRQHNTAGAEAALRQAIEQSEGRTEPLRFAQADLLVELGEIERAEEILASLQEEIFRSLIRGKILAARGELDEALAALAVGLQHWPNNPGARFLAGQMALGLGDLPRAIAEFRESVRADAMATDAALALAQLYFQLGDYALAVQFAGRDLAAHSATRAEALRIGMRSLSALGRHAAARQLAGRLGQIEGEEISAAVELAAVEREARDAAAAAEVIERSGLDLRDPANELALRALVDHLLEQAKFDSALSRIDAALRRDGSVAALHDLRGRTLVRAGRAAEARRSFEAALNGQPGYAPALSGLATLAAQGGELEQAVGLLRTASREDPGHVESRYHLAQLLISLGRLEQAETELRRLVRGSPAHAGACNDLAWVLVEQGEDLELALSLAQRATRILPEANSFDTLGWVHLRRGEMRESIAALREAAARAPEAPGIRYRLALALEASGEPDNALEAYTRAVALGPFPEAEQARAGIARLEADHAGRR